MILKKKIPLRSISDTYQSAYKYDKLNVDGFRYVREFRNVLEKQIPNCILDVRSMKWFTGFLLHNALACLLVNIYVAVGHSVDWRFIYELIPYAKIL